MSSRQRKRERHEVLAAEKAPPSFLDWSEDAITFSREDHPNRIPNPGQYPLVVDPVIGNARFSKVLMDGGSSLNILYAHTLRLLGIGLDQLRPSTTPFHGVAPGKRVQPLGQIDLPVWFGTPGNYRKETLTFEVVGFRGAYHAILGRPCYAKFMAIPNYTYLKMKMSSRSYSTQWSSHGASFATTSRPILSRWFPPFHWGKSSAIQTRQAGSPSGRWS
jgi:hypothetical protein